MIKLKNIFCYIIVCIIILLSFKIPNILLENKTYNISLEIYKTEKTKRDIDVEAKNIYLVNAIHEIEESQNIVEITSNKKYLFLAEKEESGYFENIENELEKLKDYNILTNFNGIQNYKIKLINKGYYQNGEMKYTLLDILLEQDENYNLEIENKTGKILNISTRKENFNFTDKKDLMINFVKYLDLYIINDWEYINNTLKSEKAKLTVYLVENEDEYNLLIHSEERNYKYLNLYKN